MKSALRAARWNRAAWVLALTAVLVLLTAVLLPPFLPPAWRAPLMAGFHTLCHQIPERTFSIGGVPLAACHRCTGIYAGLVLGVLALPLLRLRLPAYRRIEGGILLAAVVPAALDWVGDVLGLWTNTAGSRMATGLWFGLLAGYLFAYAVTRVARRGDGAEASPQAAG